MAKIAVVHDWFNCIAGSEKVVKEMMHCYPDADVFSLVDHLTDQQRQALGIHKPITTTFINKLPFQAKFRNYLPLMPIAIEQLDLRGYDIVLSSSHAFARSCLTNSQQLHISYLHTPIRYAWDMYHEYLAQQKRGLGVKNAMLRCVLHYIRNWDRSTADRPDVYIANSGYVRNRIKKTYNREAHVVYPPVDVHRMKVERSKDDFFLAAGRLVPYKRFDLVVEAMKHLPNERLVLIGDGPEMKKIKSLAGSNVEVMGYQSDEVMHDHMRRAKAFVFAAIEDFGIMPVEAQACGTPVIGINQGGVAETVIHRETGLLFQEQTVASLTDAMATLAEVPADFFDPNHIRQHAETFGCEVFRDQLQAVVSQSSIERAKEMRIRKPGERLSSDVENSTSSTSPQSELV